MEVILDSFKRRVWNDNIVDVGRSREGWIFFFVSGTGRFSGGGRGSFGRMRG